MAQISKTPLVACLRYRGYGFAWFYDSNLALAVANNLASAGLIQDVIVYKDYNVDDLHLIANWHYLEVHGHGVFICYHRTYKVSEVHEIGSIISNTIKEFKDEKSSYKSL